MKAKTHIGKMRALYASNRQSILAATGLSEIEYSDMYLDMGSAYLDAVYPPQDARYADCNKKAKADRDFWKWWLSEWKLNENEFLKAFPNGEGIDKEEFTAFMACMLQIMRVDMSFANSYLRGVKRHLWGFKINDAITRQ